MICTGSTIQTDQNTVIFEIRFTCTLVQPHSRNSFLSNPWCIVMYCLTGFNSHFYSTVLFYRNVSWKQSKHCGSSSDLARPTFPFSHSLRRRSSFIPRRLCWCCRELILIGEDFSLCPWLACVVYCVSYSFPVHREGWYFHPANIGIQRLDCM